MKQKMKKMLTLMLAFCIILTALPVNAEAKTKVKLNKTKITVTVGNYQTLKLSGISKKEAKSVKWSTSNKKVATVKAGKVTAKKVGNAVITATYKKQKYTCKVTVPISLSEKKCVINMTDSKVLKLYGASAKSVKWSTSNKKIATVKAGKVTAKKAGKVTITAKYKNKKYKCKVTVPKTGLSQKEISLKVGETKEISLNGASVKKVKWSVSDAKIISFANGKVTGLKEGNANLTAVFNKKNYICKVTVSKSDSKDNQSDNKNDDKKDNDTKNDTESDDPDYPDVKDTPNHKHNFVMTVTKQATCISKGEKVYVCDCGEKVVKEIPMTAHTFKKNIVSPTCQSEGYTENTCTVCGYKEITDKTDKTGHDMETVTISPATCLGDGMKSHTCKNCGYSYTEVTNPLGHDFKLIKTVESICSSQGNSLYECTRCGLTKEVANDYGSHDFEEEYTVDLQATCILEGVKSKHCKNCGAVTDEQSIPATGHDREEAVHENEIPATCTNDGSYTEVIKCSRCHVTLERNEKTVKATGHDFTEYTSNADATCTADGTKTRRCNRCNITETVKDENSAYGHHYLTKTVMPTCTMEGYTVYTCDRCGESHTDDILPSLGHQCTATVEQNADCTHTGIIHYECRICGYAYTEIEDALGHDYVSVGRVESACSASGNEKFKCSRCGHEKEIALNPNDHTFENDYTTDTEATCTLDGIKSRHCKNCSARTDEKVIPATGHKEAEKVLENKVDATCLMDGSYDEAVYCQYCKKLLDKKHVEVKALGHKYLPYISNHDETCVKDGTKTSRCERCDSFITCIEEGSRLEHDYVKNIVKPTCMKGGYTVYTCSRCQDSYTADETDKLSHDYEETVLKQADCLNSGIMKYICKNCGDSYVTEVSPLGHDYVLIGNVPSKCTSKGNELYECSRCKRRKEVAIDVMSHFFNNKFVTEIEPTCTSNGLAVRRCNICNAIAEEKILPATGHHISTKTENEISATCIKDGSMEEVTYCDKCGLELTRKSKVLKALGHNFSDYVSNNDADCETDGTKTATCLRCHITDTKTDAGSKLSHDYEKETVNPTCTKGGYTVYTCKRCGYTYTGDYKAVLSHDLVKTVIKEADCLNTGKNHYACKNCGYSYDEVTDALGHDMELIGIKESVCSTKGNELYRCSRCGYEKEIAVNPSDHDFSSDYIIDIAPTCTLDGIKSKHCKNCGAREDEQSIPATGHNEITNVENYVKATCLLDGSYDEVTLCKNCGVQIERKTVAIKATGHSFGSYASNHDATCTKDGTKTAICENCGLKNTVTDIGSRLSHDYEKTVHDATCTEDGYTVYTCKNCKDTYISDIVNALSHKFNIYVEKQATCVVDGKAVKSCERCGYTVISNIPALTHDYVLTEVIESACSASGNNKYVCSRCGDVKIEAVNPNEHDFEEEFTTDEEATCEKNGVKSRHCKNCEARKDITVIKSTGHIGDLPVKENEVKATCSLDGSYEETVYCKNCGILLSKTVRKENALGHDYTEYVSNHDATCLLDGTKTATCLRCGKTDTKADTGSRLSHDYKEISSQDATCLQNGIKVYKCSICGDITRKELPALGHDYTNTQKDATCLINGYVESVCTRCGNSIHTDIPALGHKEVSAQNEKEATCKNEGKEADIICERCGILIKAGKAIPMTAHEMVKTGHTDSACSNAGNDIYTCKYCGYTEEIALSPSNHDFSDTYTVAVNPTCVSKGLKYRKCKNCDAVTDKTEIDALGHLAKEAVIENEVPATCTKNGSYTEVIYCERCNIEINRTTVITKKASHVFGAYVSNHDATCLHEETETAKCKNCNTTVTRKTGILGLHHIVKGEEIPATCTTDGKYADEYCDVCGTVISVGKAIYAFGHDISEEEIIEKVKSATCLNNGLERHYYICNICQTRFNEKDIIIPATGHTFSEFVSDGNAECETDGTKTQVCKTCGFKNTVTDTGSRLGHNYGVKTVHEATCYLKGYDEYICSRCGNSKKENYTPFKHVFATGYVYSSDNGIEEGRKGRDCVNCGLKGADTQYAVVLRNNYGVKSISFDGVSAREDETDTKHYFKAGDSVTVKAIMENGAEFKDITGDVIVPESSIKRTSGTEIIYTFTMPEQAVYTAVNSDQIQKTKIYQADTIKGVADGTSYSPVISINAPYDKLLFKIGNDFKDAMPSYSQAGTYEAVFKIILSDSYESIMNNILYDTEGITIEPETDGNSKSRACITGRQTIIIEKETPQCMVSIENWKYGEKAPLPKTSINLSRYSSVSFSYKEKDATEYKDITIPNSEQEKYELDNLKAGSYTLKAHFENPDDKNESCESTCDFIVSASEYEITCEPNEGLVYNGNKQVLADIISEADNNLKFAVTTEKQKPSICTLDKPVATDAGTYYVYYMSDDTGYDKECHFACEVEIAKAENDIYLLSSDSYTGKESANIQVNNEAGSALTASGNADITVKNNKTLQVKFTQNGIISIDVTSAETKNYNSTTKNIQFTVYDVPALYRYEEDESTNEVKEILIKRFSESGILQDLSNAKDILSTTYKNATAIRLPKSITKINDNAFEGCTTLSAIYLPDSITEVGEGAFRGCTNLSSVMGFDELKLTEIKADTFSGCSSMTSFDFPSDVTKIGENAFKGCTSLALVLNSSITEIGNGAVKDVAHCCNLTDISNESLGLTDEKTEHVYIYNDTASGKIYYLTNCYYCGMEQTGIFEYGTNIHLGEYTKDTTAEEIKNMENTEHGKNIIIRLPEGMTEIKDNAFTGCTNLVAVYALDKITSIGNSAFKGCTNLKNLYFMDDVTHIGNEAFSGCDNHTLTDSEEASTLFLQIPLGVIKNGKADIGENAFKGLKYENILFEMNDYDTDIIMWDKRAEENDFWGADHSNYTIHTEKDNVIELPDDLDEDGIASVSMNDISTK